MTQHVQDEHTDFYEVLELDESASQEEIRRAYRRLVRKHHPDVNPLAQTSVLFRQVQEAYETLRDPEKREAYDRELKERQKSLPISMKVVPSHTVFPAWQEPQMLYLVAEVRAIGKAIPPDRRLNLCLLLDRSTSMEGVRIQHAIASATSILEQLSPRDTVSVVVFSDRTEVIVPAQSGGTNPAISSRLRGIETGGGTEVAQGLAQALRTLAEAWRPGAISHLLLLTDGHTYGDEDRCLRLAEEAGRQQIAISAFGIGTEWNEEFLDRIALASGGLSFYVDAPERIGELFTGHVRHLSSLVCPDLKVACWLEPDMTLASAFLVSPQVYRLSWVDDGFMRLGGLGGHVPSTALLEVVVGPRSAGSHRVGTLQAKGMVSPGEAEDNEGVRTFALRHPIRIEIQDPPFERPPAPPEVVRAARQANLVKLEEHARKDLERGWHEDASKRLHALATQMLELGEQEMARTITLEADRVSRVGKMSPEGQKRVHYGTRALLPPA
ncbi:MAG: DnaJ domain-containing protein [Anaerolineae bacterium]